MKKKITFILGGVILFLIVIFMPLNSPCGKVGAASCSGNIFTVLQDISTRASNGGIINPSEPFNYIECAIISIINLLMEFGVFIAILMVVIAGVKYMTSAGNSTKQQAAVKALNSSVIGFALLLCAQSLLLFATNFLEYTSFVNQFNSSKTLPIDRPDLLKLPDTTPAKPATPPATTPATK